METALEDGEGIQKKAKPWTSGSFDLFVWFRNSRQKHLAQADLLVAMFLFLSTRFAAV